MYNAGTDKVFIEDTKEPLQDPSSEPVVAPRNHNETPRNKCGEQVVHFCSTTTCHGLTHIVNRDDKLLFRICWAVVVTCFVLISVQSVYLSVVNLANRKLTSEFYETSDNLAGDNTTYGMTLPDIHICDSSIFNATRLKEIGFNSTMATYLTLATSDNSVADSLLTNLNKQKALKEEFDRILANGSWTMKDVVEHATIKCTDMLMGCTMAGHWYPAKTCCQTFFAPEPYVSIFGSCSSTHGRVIKQEYASRDAGFVVYAIPNARHIINFDHSLIKAEYILQEGLYYAVSSPTNHIEFILHTTGRYALPNSWVSARIIKSVVDNSELKSNYLAPYTCVNSDDPVHTELKTPDYPYYSEINCITSIYQKNYRRFMNCSSIFSSYGNATDLCEPSQIVGVDMDLVIKDVPTEKPNDICPVECVIVTYDLSPSYAEINKAILVNKYDSEKILKTNLERDPVMLHFFYSSFHYQVRKSHTSTFTIFLGEVGGNLGLFLGVSLITIVEFLVLCVRCCAP